MSAKQSSLLRAHLERAAAYEFAMLMLRIAVRMRAGLPVKTEAA